MRGKVVNLTIGLIDILFGLAIGFFAYYIPQDITQVTVQEEQVKTYILFALYVLLGIIILFNLIEWFAHKKDGEKYYGCILVFFSLLFLFFKDVAVGVLPLVGGIMIIDKTRKARLIESSSTGLISFFVLIATLIVMVGVATFAYKQIGISIKDNENKNETPFKQDYFKYVTELDIESPYINVKKGGKYGYIDMMGNVVIEFNLDFATPFVNIVQFDKQFQIALVCQNGSTYIILKNGRKVMSYRSESNDENYEAKYKELEDLYKNTFGQVGPMTFEINKVTDNKIRLPIYEEDKTKSDKDYTYRYSYNDEYDILITESQLGLGNKFQLAKKEDLTYRLDIDCEKMDYDDKYLYIFSNYTLPFYDTSKKEQGWFNTRLKKTTMTGKAQICDFYNDRILIRNFNNRTLYFIDGNSKIVSDLYRDIYVSPYCFIVKNQKNKYQFINGDYQAILQDEYDIVDPYLGYYGLYIVGDTSNGVSFNNFSYANMDFKLIDLNGNVIMDGVQQIYSNTYKISTDKSKSYSSRYSDFLEEVKDIEYHFVGDKFYENY